MIPWPDSNEAVVRRYVEQLRVRSAVTRKSYSYLLRAFQRFIEAHAHDNSVSQPIIQCWLRDRAQVWPPHMLLHRAWLINRFLDWLVANRLLASNPLATLRQTFGQRNTPKIIQALISSDSAAALEALRPARRFASPLGPFIQHHLKLMQALGRRYHNHEGCLVRLDRFLQHRADLVGQPLAAIAREWAKEQNTAQQACICMETVRALAKTMRRADPSVVVPPVDRNLVRLARQQRRRPHIYSEEEIARLLNTALSFPSPGSPLRPETLYTMLVLGYCLGLRLGEIAHLTMADIDLEHQTVEVRETKFFKSRLLPVTASVTAALRDYLRARRQGGAPSHGSAPLFWQQRTSKGYCYKTIGGLLVRVIRQAGLKPSPGRVGPRIHDLRHAFVVHRMTAWYREGVDPQSRLPYLATYLGHKDITSTVPYLTVTGELLQQACNRFRTLGAAVLEAANGGDPCL